MGFGSVASTAVNNDLGHHGHKHTHLALCSEVIWKNNVPQQCHAETTMELAAGLPLLSPVLGKNRK